MLLDAFLFSILVIFVVSGAARGTLAAGSGLVALLVGYGGGVFCASQLAGNVASEFDIPEIYAAAAAGSVGFVVFYVVAAIAGSLLKRMDRALLENEKRGTIDRLGGALFGGLRGGLIVILLAWLAIWIDAGRDLGAIAGLENMPEAEESHFANGTREVVAGVVEAALREPGGTLSAQAKVAANLAARPGQALRGFQELLNDPSIAHLQEDQFFWTLIENGSSERALNRLSFYKISHNDLMRRQFADLGIVSAEAASDVEQFRNEARDVFDRVGPKLKGLREDPELLRLAENPEIIRLIQTGDTLALISRPEIRSLVDRIAAR